MINPDTLIHRALIPRYPCRATGFPSHDIMYTNNMKNKTTTIIVTYNQ